MGTDTSVNVSVTTEVVDVMATVDKINPRPVENYDIPGMARKIIAEDFKVLVPPLVGIGPEFLLQWPDLAEENRVIFRGHQRLLSCKDLLENYARYGVTFEQVKHLAFLECRVMRNVTIKEGRRLAFDVGTQRNMPRYGVFAELLRLLDEEDMSATEVARAAGEGIFQTLMGDAGTRHIEALKGVEDARARNKILAKALTKVNHAAYALEMGPAIVQEALASYMSDDVLKLKGWKPTFNGVWKSISDLHTLFLKVETGKWKPVTKILWDDDLKVCTIEGGDNGEVNALIVELVKARKNGVKPPSGLTKKQKADEVLAARSPIGVCMATVLKDNTLEGEFKVGDVTFNIKDRRTLDEEAFRVHRIVECLRKVLSEGIIDGQIAVLADSIVNEKEGVVSAYFRGVSQDVSDLDTAYNRVCDMLTAAHDQRDQMAEQIVAHEVTIRELNKEIGNLKKAKATPSKRGKATAATV